MNPDQAPAQFEVDRLRVRLFGDRRSMGRQAGQDVAARMRTLLSQKDKIRMVFAAAPSQDDFLATLSEEADVAWDRVAVFHMDEYIGLPAGAPQRFSSYLETHLFDRVTPGEVHLIDGARPAREACERYGQLISAAPIDIVCLGIGENGHIAFNDPPVANFSDPEVVKVVELDAACRQQQVNDGCFPSIDEVPRRAITLTIPALLSGSHLFCIVPGPTKRAAVQATLTGPITTACPASILRQHPACTLYLDGAAYGEPYTRRASR